MKQPIFYPIQVFSQLEKSWFSSRCFLFCVLTLFSGTGSLLAQTTVTINPAVKYQVMDGFGTCLSGTEGESTWMQNLYYDDAGCSILRMDIVPRFVSPYSDNTYNSPWFHNNPPLPGPDDNNVRSYTDASDYTRLFNGNRAQIAVMGPDINANITKFDYTNDIPRVAGAMAQAGLARKNQLGDFKLTASMWSPAPWLKIPSGNIIGNYDWPLPIGGTPFPLIWADNFVGGKLDVSDTPRAEFFDGVENTSALTQFARSTAAYVKGFQDTYDVSFYSISIQNELNFETFYNSATYPLSSQYIAALKAVRAEFDKYPDLQNIKLMGPEDLLGADAYGLWEYGKPQPTSVDPVVHKNLQYLTEIAKDPAATAAIDFFCIHGYAPDGVSSAGANSQLWEWWANGWTTSPASGIPGDIKGFRFYNKKSWMTETSGEEAPWLYPTSGFPNNGAFSVALKMDQAITEGRQSAWIYWQFADGKAVSESTITDAQSLATAAKFNAFKHFSKYIRPNAERIETSLSDGSGIRASSYLHQANQSLVIVLINSNEEAREITVNVPATSFSLSAFDAYTSSDNNYWQQSTLTVSQQKVTITVPGYGVSTLVGSGSAVADTQAPSAPTDVTANATTSSSVSLTWSASTDNVGVAGYDVYRGTTKVNTALITTTSFTVSGLTANTAYSFTVKAKDAAGNESAASAALSVTTQAGTVTLRDPENPASTVAGLEYEYFEGTWNNLPDFSSLTAVETGNVNNFDLSIRNRDDNFAVQFEGYINVPADGSYTFYTTSDDGSKLYIGDTEVVNNDGLHGAQERSGSIGLKAGKHALTVVFFENTGGQVLSVSYSGPSLSKTAVPASALFRTGGGTTDPDPEPGSCSKLTGTVIGTDAVWCCGRSRDKVFDGDLTTFMDVTDAYKDNAWAGLDLGSPKVIVEVKYAPRADQADRMVGGKFQGSNTADFSSGVVDLFTITTQPAVGVLTTQAVSNTTAFRYVRFLSPVGGHGNVAEVEFCGTSGSAAKLSNEAKAVVRASVSPNPASGQLNVTVETARAGEARIGLISLLNQEVVTRSAQLQAGSNLITLPVEHLRRGLYLLSVYKDGRKMAIKVVLH